MATCLGRCPGLSLRSAAGYCHGSSLSTCLQIDVSFWADIADLRLRPSLSDRGVPPVTGVNDANGTALDRHSSGHLLGRALSGPPGFSGAARVCLQGRSKRALAAPEVRGRALPARAGR